MTILSKQALVDLLDLIADGATVQGASAAIGCAPKSKSVFGWLADSEAAGEFGAKPDPDSVFTLTWGEREPEWFHLLYIQAVADGKAARASRKSPLQQELEARLAAKRAEQHKPSPPPHIQVFRADDEPAQPRVVQAPIAPPPPPAPKPRPAYAYQSRPLDRSGYTEQPPSEGRFSVARHVTSAAERLAGTVEITDSGIVRH